MLGGCPDPSAAIEVSLGGLPPKGGSVRGEGGRDFGAIRLDSGVGGIEEYDVFSNPLIS